MDLWYPDDDIPSDMGWWTPLLRFGLAMARAGLPAINPNDYMLMGRIDRKGRPRIWLYKHIDTRRYVNVADDGTPYRYIPPKDWNSRYEGRYVLHRNPKTAWWHLGLWTLREELDDVPDPDEPPGLEEFDDYYELVGLDELLRPPAPAA
jgi:hypothetical protein